MENENKLQLTVMEEKILEDIRNNLTEIIKNKESFNLEEIVLKSIIKSNTEQENETIKLFKNFTQFNLNDIYALTSNYNNKMRSCVYVIKNEENNQCKIGKTKNIKKRMIQLKNSFTFVGIEPKLKLVVILPIFEDYAYKFEHSLHEMYAKNRNIGEWFDINAEDFVRNEISTSNIDDFVFINGVFVGCTAYECDYYKKVNRFASFNNYLIFEKILKIILEKEYFIKDPIYNLLFNHTLNTGNDKSILSLSNLVESIDKCNIGYKSTSIRDNKFYIKEVITNNNVECLSFSELKHKKFKEDYNYWTKIISEI